MSITDKVKANKAGTVQKAPCCCLAHIENPAPINGPNTNPMENAIPIKA